MAMRRIATVTLAGVLVAASACSSPTSACDDPRAIHDFNTVLVTCTPAGSDAKCTATAEKFSSYVCGTRTLDVTDSAVFSSSDPSIAKFDAPGAARGYLTAVGTGNVTITADYRSLDLLSTPYMFLSPGIPSENLVDLFVSVRNAVTLAKIPGAAVTVTPDKGLPQTGETNQGGAFRLWLRHGIYIISATAPGFQPGQSTFASGATSISLTTTLDLIPKSP